MTIPYLMNCPHHGDGWCLDCVKEQGEALVAVEDEIRSLRKRLVETLLLRRDTTRVDANPVGVAVGVDGNLHIFFGEESFRAFLPERDSWARACWLKETVCHFDRSKEADDGA